MVKTMDRKILFIAIAIVAFSSIASADAITVTLGSPTTNTWSQSNTVTLNCSCIGNVTTTYNLTWWVASVNVSSNTTIANDTVTYYAHTFASDQCSGAAWNCECLSNETSALNGTARAARKFPS